MTLADFVTLYPTPTACSYGRNKGGQNPEGKVRLSLESMARQGGLGHRGKLNPAWVEWLMNYPTGWTAFALSATPSSLSKSRTPS